MADEGQKKFGGKVDMDNFDFKDKSGWQLLAEVCRLLLALLGQLLLFLWKMLKRLGRFLLKWICKGIVALIDGVEYAIQSAKAFWNDNDTQEKLRKIKRWLHYAWLQTLRWLRKAMRATWRGLCWTGRKTLQGLIWLAKATVRAILHIGPTLRAIGRGLKAAGIATGHFFCRMVRGISNWWQRRCDAYHRFRKNKGFKGLLIDTGVWLKGRLNNYMDEAPEEAESDDSSATPTETAAPGDDDDEVAHFFEREHESEGKALTWSKRIYNAMKKVVEEE